MFCSYFKSAKPELFRTLRMEEMPSSFSIYAAVLAFVIKRHSWPIFFNRPACKFENVFFIPPCQKCQNLKNIVLKERDNIFENGRLRFWAKFLGDEKYQHFWNKLRNFCTSFRFQKYCLALFSNGFKDLKFLTWWHKKCNLQFCRCNYVNLPKILVLKANGWLHFKGNLKC